MGDSAVDSAIASQLPQESAQPVVAAGGAGKYVAPGLRQGAAAGTLAGRRDVGGKLVSADPGRPSYRDDPAVFVNNLSPEATDTDLRELFGRFGRILRANVVRHKFSGESKGMAYINFESQADVQRAIDSLNKHAYGNLLLAVCWSTEKKF